MVLLALNDLSLQSGLTSCLIFCLTLRSLSFSTTLVKFLSKPSCQGVVVVVAVLSAMSALPGCTGLLQRVYISTKSQVALKIYSACVRI